MHVPRDLDQAPREVRWAIMLLVVWYALMVVAQVFQMILFPTEPVAELVATTVLIAMGMNIWSIASGERFGRVVLFLFVVAIHVHMLVNGETQASQVLEDPMLVLRLVVSAVPALAVGMLYTDRASRWFAG